MLSIIICTYNRDKSGLSSVRVNDQYRIEFEEKTNFAVTRTAWH
jgi:plasmid maintenance system killer protein